MSVRAFPYTLQAPSAARAFVREQPWYEGLSDRDTILLLVSEVVTNAVRHAQPPVRVILEHFGEMCRVGVEDGGPDCDAVHAQDVAAATDVELAPEGGRGLDLVEALALHWHVTAADQGKTVWFDLAC